jgi:hypothetical protein
MIQSDIVNMAKIKSVEAVLVELDLLDSKLSQNHLDQFSLFNQAYYVVTNTIKQAAEHDYFNNPEFIEKFSVCFARYYFQAINDTSTVGLDVAPAWAKINKAAEFKSVPSFILLLMGANAHINHDLPLALLETMSMQKKDDLLRDVLKIDKLLMKSGREIIGTFDESNRLVNFIKRRFQFLYYRPIMYIILGWRIIAWHNYKSINKNGLENNNHTLKSIKIANRFLKLGSYLGEHSA